MQFSAAYQAFIIGQRFTKREVIQVLLLLLTVAGPVAALDQVVAFDIAGPTASDIDNMSPTVLNFDVSEKGTISSLDVRLSIGAGGNGDEAYWDNMYVQISHAGIDVVLTDLQGDNASKVSSLDAIFTDSGTDLALALLIDGLTTGTFSPLQPLSAFNGVGLNGLWTVTLSDDTVPFDGTDLVAFSLQGEVIITPLVFKDSFE